MDIDASVVLDPSWVKNVIAFLRKRSDRRSDEFDYLSDNFSNIEILPERYVEPYASPTNPADFPTDDAVDRRKFLVNYYINDFLVRKTGHRDGRNQLFIIADGGMGKTSLLVMLKLAAMRWGRRAPPMHIEKLGEQTLENIKSIKRRRKTILLLDSLDEDPLAWGRIDKRLFEVLKATENFRKVIITCRTQYFPSLEEARKHGFVKFGGYSCPLIYLLPFDRDQVRRYLGRAFPYNRKKREELSTVILSMKSLQFRPMMLAYADDLVGMKGEITAFRVYDRLVSEWLLREARKDVEHPIDVDGLRLACMIMAGYLGRTGRRHLAGEELKGLISHPGVVERFGEIDLGGRSLLNKNAHGEFRFSHYSIQEFLLAKAISNGVLRADGIHVTRETVEFMLGAKSSGRLSIAGANCNGINLSSLVLDGMDMQGCQLRKAILDGSSLVDVNLTGACLDQSSLLGTHFHRARLDGASLLSVAFRGVMLIRLEQGDFDSLARTALPVAVVEVVRGGAIHSFPRKFLSDVDLRMIGSNTARVSRDGLDGDVHELHVDGLQVRVGDAYLVEADDVSFGGVGVDGVRKIMRLRRRPGGWRVSVTSWPDRNSPRRNAEAVALSHQDTFAFGGIRLRLWNPAEVPPEPNPSSDQSPAGAPSEPDPSSDQSPAGTPPEPDPWSDL